MVKFTDLKPGVDHETTGVGLFDDEIDAPESKVHS